MVSAEATVFVEGFVGAIESNDVSYAGVRMTPPGVVVSAFRLTPFFVCRNNQSEVVFS